MPNEDIRLLIQSLGAQIVQSRFDASGAVAVLFAETVRFRDQLLKDTGVVVTVADTREALTALERYLDVKSLPPGLTDVQSSLAQLYVDRLTLFKRT